MQEVIRNLFAPKEVSRLEADGGYGDGLEYDEEDNEIDNTKTYLLNKFGDHYPSVGGSIQAL